MDNSTELTQDEINAITQKVQARFDEAIAKHPDRAPHLERTVVHDDGHWFVRANDGMGSIILDHTAEPMVQEIKKAKRIARQRTMILACHAAMTEDEFVEWCLDVLPVLIREADR